MSNINRVVVPGVDVSAVAASPRRSYGGELSADAKPILNPYPRLATQRVTNPRIAYLALFSQ